MFLHKYELTKRDKYIHTFFFTRQSLKTKTNKTNKNNKKNKIISGFIVAANIREL